MLLRTLSRLRSAPASFSPAASTSLNLPSPALRFLSSKPPPPPSSVSEPEPASTPSRSHLTPAEEQSRRIEEVGTKPPPYLARALGVKEPPTKGKPSREEWRANLLSQKRRLEERKHL